MSKILCTLAFYHDGGTLKPQLVFSSNPVTNIVMKGADWKGVRIGNTNATVGARDRFEYSFTGGKSVTRCSLVMNTSAILPPLIWLSKHPCGPPTKTGPRAKPGTKEHEEAMRKAEKEKKRLEAKADVKRIDGRKISRSQTLKTERQQMLAEHGIYETSDGEDDRRRLRIQNRSNSRRDDRADPPPPYSEGYTYIRDREMRREERQKRLRGSSAAGSPPPELHFSPPAEPESRVPDRETRRQERLKRLRSSSSASESSNASGDRYRRSTRSGSGRQNRKYYGGDYATGREGVDDGGDTGGDGGAGGD